MPSFKFSASATPFVPSQSSEEMDKVARRKAKKQRKKEARKTQAESQGPSVGGVDDVDLKTVAKDGKKRKNRDAEEVEEDLQINIGYSQRDRSTSLDEGDENESHSLSSKQRKRKRKSSGSQSSPAAPNKEGACDIVWSLPEPRPPLSVKDVREFLMHGLGAGSAPTWASLREKGKVRRAVVLVVDSLGHVSFRKRRGNFPFLGALEKHSALVRSPGSKIEVFNLLAELLTCPLAPKPAAQTKKAKKNEQKAAAARPRDEWVMQPSDLVLTRAQLADNNFPGFGADWPPEAMRDFVKTKKLGARAEAGRMVAMDCEMCLTEEGQELTRVSLVSADGSVLYDSFVLPRNPIVDYKTKFSGVTEELLRGVSVRVEDVQAKVLSLVDAETVLVGHSLENDLKACRIQHANVIDTSVLFPHVKGAPFKNGLSFLLTKFLRKTLDRTDGHCSIADASATLELVKLKLSRGPTFGVMGDNSLAGESLFRALERGRVPWQSTLVLEKRGGGGKEMVGGSRAAVEVCEGNQEVETAVKAAMLEGGEEEDGGRLVIARIVRHAAAEGGGEQAGGSAKGEGEQRAGEEEEETVEAWERAVDARVRRVCEAAPPGALVLVLGAAEDLGEVGSMRARRRASQAGRSAGMPWGDKDERLLLQRVDAARNGVGFFFLQRPAS